MLRTLFVQKPRAVDRRNLRPLQSPARDSRADAGDACALRETQVSLDLWSDKLARVTVELSQWHRWWKQQGNRELRDLLMLWWDPLGVYSIPEGIDEYDHHVGRVGRVYDAFEARDCHPIIKLRQTTAVKRGDHKPPTCEHGGWRFAGTDYKRKATKWRCPTGECKPASRWIKADRLHPLIPRETLRWGSSTPTAPPWSVPLVGRRMNGRCYLSALADSSASGSTPT